MKFPWQIKKLLMAEGEYLMTFMAWKDPWVLIATGIITGAILCRGGLSASPCTSPCTFEVPMVLKPTFIRDKRSLGLLSERGLLQ